jgi:hypothetical protein
LNKNAIKPTLVLGAPLLSRLSEDSPPPKIPFVHDVIFTFWKWDPVPLPSEICILGSQTTVTGPCRATATAPTPPRDGNHAQPEFPIIDVSKYTSASSSYGGVSQLGTFPGPLPLGAPQLPDAPAVFAAVSALASANPGFAAMLTEGVPEAQALARLSLQLFQERRISEATAAFRSAVALALEDPVMWTNYGTALDCAGLLADAAACLEHSLALSCRRTDTKLLLGPFRKKRGDQNGCEAAYRIANSLFRGRETRTMRESEAPI